MQQDMFKKQLHPRQVEMVNKMVTALTNMGCKFIIIEPDGMRHGNLDARVAEPGKKRPLKYPFGTISRYIRPYIQPMQLGDVVHIPFHNEIAPEDIVKGASSMTCKLWGNGQSEVKLREKDHVVEVMYDGGIK